MFYILAISESTTVGDNSMSIGKKFQKEGVEYHGFSWLISIEGSSTLLSIDVGRNLKPIKITWSHEFTKQSCESFKSNWQRLINSFNIIEYIIIDTSFLSIYMGFCKIFLSHFLWVPISYILKYPFHCKAVLVIFVLLFTQFLYEIQRFHLFQRLHQNIWCGVYEIVKNCR